MKIKFKKIPLYDEFKYRVLVSPDPAGCLEYLGIKEYNGADFTGMVIYENGGFNLTFLLDQRRIRDRNFAQRLVAHECFHAACKIMRLIGCPLSEASEEPYAYLLDFLVGEVNKAIYE